MSIIESYLEKSRGHVAARQRRPDVPVAPTVEPPRSIEPHEIAVDHGAARENRIIVAIERSEDRAIAAAYGMLRTRLLHRLRAKGWSTVGVTSAGSRDGKSLTTINLSLSLAREKNNQVVLLDLDMCNPSVCHLLGISPLVELREFFQQPALAAHGLLCSIGVDRLVIAGNTAPIPNSAELLASSRLDELLGLIKSAFSDPIILIDLPPIVSVDDALVVAPRVDALLLVGSEGVTHRAELSKALELAGTFPIAGLVFNRSTEDRRRYQYRYGYGGEEPPRG